jgi:MYXO-CTERM domain-containing protein
MTMHRLRGTWWKSSLVVVGAVGLVATTARAESGVPPDFGYTDLGSMTPDPDMGPPAPRDLGPPPPADMGPPPPADMGPPPSMDASSPDASTPPAPPPPASDESCSVSSTPVAGNGSRAAAWSLVALGAAALLRRRRRQPL